ncbi:major facilitator superfamily domain-containing protein [Terfezia claveryi]|nr:major facilitator superfamily domain-containing protein [Terfezia claveryi]
MMSIETEKEIDSHDLPVLTFTLPPLTPEEQAHLLRKVDWQLLPIITLFYLMSFVDRTSIGNAKIANMDKELGLSPGQYSIALSILFVSYLSFEIPSNIILKKLKPSVWLPSICLAWGILTVCNGFVQNFGSLVVVRLLLGFMEAGLFPGVIFLLTVWYPRHAVVFRFTLFFSAATLAGAFGGLIAPGLVAADGAGGLSGWRWIFIIEGLITIIVAFLGYFLIQDSPATSRFLSTEDSAALQALLKRDSLNESEEFDWADVRAAFCDWKVYLSGIICLGIALPAFSFALFLPSIINSGLGFKATDSQLMTVPPYAAAFIFTIGAGWYSDRKKSRGIPLLFFTVIGMVGYILQLTLPQNQQGVKYFATFLCAIGLFASGINIPWLGNNLRGHTKRAVGGAVQVSTGQLGAVAASYIYRAPDAPGYFLGHGVALGFLTMAAVGTVLQWWLLRRENSKLDKEEEESVVKDSFRYTL